MINIQKVTHYYQQYKALDSIECHLPHRKCIALLGENGAGKSTLMKLLVGNLQASSGKVIINNHLMYPESEARRFIGYLPESLSLYKNMTVKNYLQWLGRMHDLSRLLFRKRLDWVVEYCQLEKLLPMNMHQLSKGMQQRVGLAQALLHEPAVLILDEVHSGLDHQQSLAINQILKTLSEQHLILVSTHRLHTIAQVADQALVLDQGKLCAFDDLDTLMGRYHNQNVFEITIKFTSGITKKFQSLCANDNVICLNESISEQSITYECQINKDISDFLRTMTTEFDLIEAKKKAYHLSDVFNKLTQN